MVFQVVRVRNQLGMHARAAARFVHVASGFTARVRVRCGEREIDGKSILGILLLAAGFGSDITIATDGPDEVLALGALVSLVDTGFGEGAPCDA
ncbi:MAG: HPr family phosphocarrier protein [Acidobacteria bacterium]|nr:HPr family phosphocarrier protein [Acidobacteriota bacterium]MBI3263134.1 HPr family phosphocarrier protein [Acidobacteriota bacterium]